DSDIKLADSDVKLSFDPSKPKSSGAQIAGFQAPSSGKRSSQVSLGSGTQPKSKAGGSSGKQAFSPRPSTPPQQPADSGARLVPLDSDSDVKLNESDAAIGRLLRGRAGSWREGLFAGRAARFGFGLCSGPERNLGRSFAAGRRLEASYLSAA